MSLYENLPVRNLPAMTIKMLVEAPICSQFHQHFKSSFFPFAICTNTNCKCRKTVRNTVVSKNWEGDKLY